MATGIRSNGFTNTPKNPGNSIGKSHRTIPWGKTIATGAGTNTLHILAGPLTFDDRIATIKGAVNALTSANANDLGFYKLNADGTFTALTTSAAASAANLLWASADLSSALSYRDLLSNLNTSLDLTLNIGGLLGLGNDQEPFGGVYLGLLVKTASTAASVANYWEVFVEQATTK